MTGGFAKLVQQFVSQMFPEPGGATNRGDWLSSKNLASRNVIWEMGYVAEGYMFGERGKNFSDFIRRKTTGWED